MRDYILSALNLRVGEEATQLGVDRTTLSKIFNGWAAISPAMALRIGGWLGRYHGGSAAVRASKALSGVRARKLKAA